MVIKNIRGEVIVDYPHLKTHGEVLELGAKNLILFHDADLSGLKLKNLNLNGIFLIGANCKGTDFTGTSFSSFNSILDSVDFTDAILVNVKFLGVDLEKSNFTNATMTNVVFDIETDLYNVIGNGKEVITKDKIVITKDIIQIKRQTCSVQDFLNNRDRWVLNTDDKMLLDRLRPEIKDIIKKEKG